MLNPCKKKSILSISQTESLKANKQIKLLGYVTPLQLVTIPTTGYRLEPRYTAVVSQSGLTARRKHAKVPPKSQIFNCILSCPNNSV